MNVACNMNGAKDYDYPVPLYIFKMKKIRNVAKERHLVFA